MIKEIAAALGGVFFALAAFFLVLQYQGAFSPDTLTYTLRNGQLPISAPFSGSTDSRLYLPGATGVYSGVLAALILVLVAAGAGFLVSHLVVARLEGGASH